VLTQQACLISLVLLSLFKQSELNGTLSTCMDMEKSSFNHLIFSALDSQKPSQFAFISIQNPGDIKDSRKQAAIRRHARASTNRLKQQERKHLKVVFDLPDAASHVEAESHAAVLPSTNAFPNVETTHVSSVEHHSREQSGLLPSWHELSTSYLRPIGSGRGLVPLKPFPVAADARIRDLTNFSMKL
jgi:hypothetical protein